MRLWRPAMRGGAPAVCPLRRVRRCVRPSYGPPGGLAVNAIGRIKLCRRCGKTSTEVRFRRARVCDACDAVQKTERAARIADRPKRVPVVKRVDPGDYPEHRAWIASMPCAVRCSSCRGDVIPHHVRTGGTGGTGLRPSDKFAVPLCDHHHKEGHGQLDTRRGWSSFELKYGVDLKWIASGLAARSPYLTAKPNPKRTDAMTPIERLTAYLAALPPSEDSIPIDCTLAGPLTVGDLRAVLAALDAANAELNRQAGDGLGDRGA